MRTIQFLLSIFFSFLAIPAFAVQTNQVIRCEQINKDGSKPRKPANIELNLRINQDGKLSAKQPESKATGFSKQEDDLGLSPMMVSSVNESSKKLSFEFTNFFIYPVNDYGMLDVQLQFDTLRVFNTNFTNVPATFVIGSEDANPETSWAYGFRMMCSGRVQ